MNNILYSIGQYATKAEVSQLIADEYNNTLVFREASSGINAVGESPKQRFEALLLETRTEDRNYAHLPPNELPPLPTEAIQEPKYWIQDPSPSGIRTGQYKEQYVIPTQNTSALPKRVYGAPLDYDSKYTMNRQIGKMRKISGSEAYTPQSRWNNYKGVQVPTTQKGGLSGDAILRSFMGLDSPSAIRSSGYTIDSPETIDTPLEVSHNQEPEYYNQNAPEMLKDRTNPMTVMEIQSKAMSMSLGGILSNNIYNKTEENLDRLSKGGE